MISRATLHLPIRPTSGYVRVDVDGATAGYLHSTFYDVIVDEEGFAAAMAQEGAEEIEMYSIPGRRVVRLWGEAALRAVHAHFSTP